MHPQTFMFSVFGLCLTTFQYAKAEFVVLSLARLVGLWSFEEYWYPGLPLDQSRSPCLYKFFQLLETNSVKSVFKP